MTRRKYIEATTDWESDLKRGQDALVVQEEALDREGLDEDVQNLFRDNEWNSWRAQVDYRSFV